MDNRFLAIIEDSIKNNWDLPALSDYNGQTYKYKDFAHKIAELHLIFDSLNIQKGNTVAICGRNMANWVVSFFATISYGAVPTTILHDFDSQSIHNIINHSEAKFLFVGEYVWEKLDPKEMPAVETIILIDDFSIIKSRSEQTIEIGSDTNLVFNKKYPDGFSPDDVKYHKEKPEELAVLNYTSGTTSTPKGVMIPYRSLWSNTRFAIDMIPFVKRGDGFVSMLPMAHMYGLAFEILLSIAKGCHINFLTRVPSPQIIVEAFAKVKPTLIIAVPLIIEKIIKNKVFVELDKQPVKTLIKLPFIKQVIYKKVLNKLMATFGGNLVEVVIGGAALNKEVGDFLTKIKFPYTVGYGMTECGPLISYEYWETYRPTSCGKPVDRMSVKIDSSDRENISGEIMVKGDNVMLGYFKNPEETEKVIENDGWLHTGDLGVIDKDGHIYIKGRSKTMILGGSGQNIYPEEIEGLLNNYPYVLESLIIEEEGKLVALIVPDQDQIKKGNIKQSQIESIFQNEIKNLNKRLPSYSQITKVNIRDEEFEKTPKRSIRRFLYQK
ncbi:long-chain fatty acid--CoA ligase [Dysgonomonas sp. 216]|uniref:AMP-binding protein n=1 Tax=Dysgonomonas sp. 216 TaxID=2302934 RepID=UPI0013D5F142|nr:AMP-binding protein [Dysgonomonas sp. 216]NDW17863.1 long-chain fatty acid--CoA ligase [Dysgonomonas sp. 216]